MEFAKEKIEQTIEILDELDIDLWITLCRESSTVPDPVTNLIVGMPICWLSGFFITKDGKTTVLVGEVDAADYENSGLYQEVMTYSTDVSSELLRIIKRFDPKNIAINYSLNNCTADGLSHGLYLFLCEALLGTPYVDRLISSEEIVARLRGRKTTLEIARLERAAEMAAECWQRAVERIEVGMNEIQIAALIEGIISDMGGTPSFETIVNAGSKTKPGHGSPTTALLEKGDLLHVDFGVQYEGYCSDIQRLAYFLKDHEEKVPEVLVKAFDTVRTILEECIVLYKPDAIGHEIDGHARKRLREEGYSEYNHALGHQIGQAVHDGGAGVGPQWPRYGDSVKIPLEKSNTFTVEFGVTLDGIGHVSLEEDLEVTEQGGRLLCTPQTELVIK